MIRDQIPSDAINYLHLTTDRKLDEFVNHVRVNYEHRANFKKPLELQNLRSEIGFKQHKAKATVLKIKKLSELGIT